MARSRRPAGSSSSSYQRRNERARAAGYRNYYDYRIHNHGRLAPEAAPPPAGSAERSRLRGHRGTADLVRTLRRGDMLLVPDGIPEIVKDAKGRYQTIDVLVLRVDGTTDRFTVRRRDYEQMSALLERMAAKGAVFSPQPSLDLRRLVRVADRPDVDDDEEPDE